MAIRSYSHTDLLCVISEFIFAYSHPYQTYALHGFGSKHAIRFISCIYKDSFQIRHYSIIVLLEVLLLKHHVLAIIIQTELKI